MSTNNKVLFITTSVSEVKDRKAGVWFEELSTPYYIITEGGYEVDIVSSKGGEVPFDPLAFEEENITDSVKKFQNDTGASKKITDSKKLSEVDFEDYAAIFFPGGHAAMFDLPNDKVLAQKLGNFFDSGKVVAAVCHGPAGLVAAKKSNGDSIVKDRKVNCFSNSEEDAVGATENMPFLLETRLGELGGEFVKNSEDFGEFVVVDGNLITGQNPASSKKIAEKILENI